MQRKKRYRIFLMALFLGNLIGIFFCFYYEINKKIPDQFHLLVNTKEHFHFGLPIEAEIEPEEQSVFSVNQKKLCAGQIHLNLQQSFSVNAIKTGSYPVNLKLFGLVQLKKVQVHVIPKKKLIPSGLPVGIYVETNGILVLGTSPIPCVDGLQYEPALHLLKSGDYIIKCNGKTLQTKEAFLTQIRESKGMDLLLCVRRKNRLLSYRIKPVKTVSGEYKLGVWIRSDTQGIGTLTYTDSNGNFGALGHGITDVDTSLLMQMRRGAIYHAKIMEIVKGEAGKPGEMVGFMEQTKQQQIGTLKKNVGQGIFGVLNESGKKDLKGEAIPIGLKQEVRLGTAWIRSQIEGRTKDYQIKIRKIEWNSTRKSKGLVIQIVDKRLLRQTNGIVQGMSGSPILQNGKLIGAVTHVFIQDATKGYGTFIENMLEQK